VVEHVLVFDHAGLLVNTPPGKAGLRFLKSSGNIRSCFGGHCPLAHAGRAPKFLLSSLKHE
jgi:hypothetical protein